MRDAEFINKANQYKDTIYRIAFNYFKNPHDAEDTVQEVLLKLYTSKNNFESDQHTRHWIIRVTVNHCKNILRMPWRRRRVALDEIKEYGIFDTSSDNDLLVDVMQLPDKYRIIIYLFYYEDYSTKEIAEILKISETAVTTRLSRGRKQLKLRIREV